MQVAVLGASDKSERYSFKAVKQLLEAGHKVYPVHPKLKEILDLPVFSELESIDETPDTVSVYLSARNSSQIADSLVACKARRFIFNPGSENPKLQADLAESGKLVVEACTLVLLSTGQF